MLESSGEITPPCGVPATVAVTRPVFHHTCLEPLPISLSIRRSEIASRHQRQKLPVVDAAEVVADIGIEDVIPASGPTRAQRFKCLRGAPPRPEAIRAREEIRLENRLQYQRRRHLHHSVSDRRNPEWSLSGHRPFGMYRRRTGDGSIRARAQRDAEGVHNRLHARVLDVGEGHRDRPPPPRGSASPAAMPPQDVTPGDAVHTVHGSGAPVAAWPRSIVDVAIGALCPADSRPLRGGWTSAGHALARPCVPRPCPPQETLRSPRVVRRAARHYYGPLGLPLRRARFRRSAYTNRAAPTRAAQTGLSCSVPSPCHACCALLPRRDLTMRASPD